MMLVKEGKELLKDFENKVHQEKWATFYDKDSDSFSLRKPNLSADTRIKYFDDEIAFYLSKDRKIEGVFIEYFRTNFLEHHSGLKSVAVELKNNDSSKSVVTLDAEEAKKVTNSIENLIKQSLGNQLQTA